MRSLFLASTCLAMMALSVYFSISSQTEKFTLQIELVDQETGKPLAGLIRVITSDRSMLMDLAGLYNRFKGLEKSAPVKGWFVIPAKGATTTLPKGDYFVEAISGLETAQIVHPIQIRNDQTERITIKLKPFFHSKKSQLVPGNTHLHLSNMTKAQAEEYLKQIPAADGLQVLFISYLERHKDDKGYITNTFPIGDLKQFHVTGVLMNNGEEHRHNFKAYGQGYGHVMFLDIQKIIKPVSIGQGIMDTGFDDLPLRPGIDEAKKQGGTVIWCHNTFGYEDVLIALTGRLDAMNVFDGSRKDSYEDTYYRYLNIGIRLPISTGTDWFLYDFSRVYARVTEPLTIKSWLQAVKSGRCQATNGPLLSLTVDGKEIGSTINLSQPKTVQIEARGICRHPFGKIELIHNGKVIKNKHEQKKSDHFTAEFVHKVPVDKPGWFALRIDSAAKNELGQPLFAHTSPVYVDLQGAKCFDVESAKDLLKQVEEGKSAIQAQGLFSNPQARESLLKLYDQARADLTKRINQKE